MSLDFAYVASGPMVRSSYHADRMAAAAGYVAIDALKRTTLRTCGLLFSGQEMVFSSRLILEPKVFLWMKKKRDDVCCGQNYSTKAH